jgi:ribose transport system ATP-binding protein
MTSLVLQSLSKAFGPTRAVHDVALSITPGQVLGLVGENGAGKSTVLKMVAGLLRADSGAIRVGTDTLVPGSLHDAQAHGIRCAFQELTIIGGLTIGENLALADPGGRLTHAFGWEQANATARAILQAHELDLDPRRDAGSLMLGDQYRLEIVKALAAKPSFLLLDESTAALSAAEVDWLERQLIAFTAAGGGVVFISHRWEEIERFCGRVAILRNGVLVHESPTTELDRESAVTMMSGQPVGSIFPARKNAPQEKIALRLENVSGPGLAGVTLEVRKGEILGLAGLAGQGQESILRTVFGLQKSASGSMELFGRPYARATPRQAQRRRIGFVPLDRKREGLFLGKPIRFNLAVVTRQIRAGRVPFISRRREQTFVESQIAAIDIRPPNPEAVVVSLSGGNQQKVLFQRVMAEKLDLLLLADVTRGVDIQTKRELYRHVRIAADKGSAVLLYSTDTEELTGLCDRVAVLHRGRIVSMLAPPRLTRENIVSASLAISEDNPSPDAAHVH